MSHYPQQGEIPSRQHWATHKTTGIQQPFESFPQMTEKCEPPSSALVSVTTAAQEEQAFSLRSLLMVPSVKSV